MTQIRLIFYVLYIALGAIILVRLVGLGIRWETFSGIVLGLALIALGFYRLVLYYRSGATQRR